MLNLLVVNASLHGHNTPVQIGCMDGKIVEIAPVIKSEAQKTVDAGGYLVSSHMPETVATVNLGAGDIDVDFCI